VLADVHIRYGFTQPPYTRGFVQLGISELQQLLATSPTYDAEHPDFSPSMRLSLVFLNINQPHNAVLYGQQAVQQNPKNPVAYGILADAHNALANYPAAAQYYQRALAHAKGWNFHFPILGRDDAQQRAITQSTWYVRLGAAYYLAGNYTQSKSAYDNALRYDSRHLSRTLISPSMPPEKEIPIVHARS
jgi:tetratricopeptide (TPR) repeat protein